MTNSCPPPKKIRQKSLFAVFDRSKLPVVHVVQPGSRTGGEVWVPAAAAGGEVRAGAVGGAAQGSYGRVDPRPPTLRHDGNARVRVDQAGDEVLVSGHGLERARRLGSVGAVGADVVELVLGGDGAVLQGEGAVVGPHLAAAHGRRGLAEAAVDAVGETQV